MNRWLINLCVLAAACAPPPIPSGGGGEPSIVMLFPPRDAGTLPLNEEGVLTFLIVADVNGIEYVPPADGAVDVDGEGHYHVTVNDVYIGAPSAQAYQFKSGVDEYTVGQALSVRVSLQSNTHRDLDESPDWEDIAEYTVGEAPTP